jgi:hypothetical protein
MHVLALPPALRPMALDALYVPSLNRNRLQQMLWSKR